MCLTRPLELRSASRSTLRCRAYFDDSAHYSRGNGCGVKEVSCVPRPWRVGCWLVIRMVKTDGLHHLKDQRTGANRQQRAGVRKGLGHGCDETADPPRLPRACYRLRNRWCARSPEGGAPSGRRDDLLQHVLSRASGVEAGSSGRYRFDENARRKRPRRERCSGRAAEQSIDRCVLRRGGRARRYARRSLHQSEDESQLGVDVVPPRAVFADAGIDRGYLSQSVQGRSDYS